MIFLIFILKQMRALVYFMAQSKFIHVTVFKNEAFTGGIWKNLVDEKTYGANKRRLPNVNGYGLCACF